MKKTLLTIIVLCWSHAAFAQQYILSYTTLNGAVTATATQLVLTSASAVATANVAAPAVGQMLYVDHEAMTITAISGTRVTVARGQSGTYAAGHASGATIFSGPTNVFRNADPAFGTCTIASFGVWPWINVITGNVWRCIGSKTVGTNVANITYNSLNPY